MDQEKLFKYLSFLRIECERHNADNEITDDEINQLNIEINRFIDYVSKSDNLNNNIKRKILSIDFNLDSNNHNKRSKSKFFWWLIGGDYGYRETEQTNRKYRFKQLSEDIENLEFELKAIL